MLFSNKTIWITGASSGIGRELALQLAGDGVTLILTARNVEKLSMLSDSCTAKGAACYVLPADLYDTGIVKKLVEDALACTGHIDMVIHSAGISQRSLSTDTTPEVYRQLMQLNYFAPVDITAALLPHFTTHNRGHIAFINSMAGLMGFPMRSGYSAAKHALKGYSETLQAELLQTGIAITSIYAGRIQTPISLSAVTGDGTAWGRLDAGQQQGIPVATCARKIIGAIVKKKKRKFIAKNEIILWWLWYLFPAIYYLIAHKKGHTPGN